MHALVAPLSARATQSPNKELLWSLAGKEMKLVLLSLFLSLSVSLSVSLPLPLPLSLSLSRNSLPLLQVILQFVKSCDNLAPRGLPSLDTAEQDFDNEMEDLLF
jgi:hypothetical protein